MARKQIISFTIDPGYEDYLRTISKSKGMTVSQYLRKLIKDDFDSIFTVNAYSEDDFLPVDSGVSEILYNKNTQEYKINGKKYRF